MLHSRSGHLPILESAERDTILRDLERHRARA